MTTSLSPQMQGAADRAFSAAATPYQKEYVPQGMDQLASALLGKVGGHYGLSGSNLNTNLQQQKPSAGMGPQAPQGMGGGMPQLGGMQGGIPGQQAMGQMGMPPMGQLQGGAGGMPSLGGMGGMPSGLNFNQPGMGQQQTQPMPQQVI